MKLPLHIAIKLLQLSNGEKIPASKLKFPIIQDLIDEGIIHKPGKLKSTLQVTNAHQLMLFLQNRFSIQNLEHYVTAMLKEDALRSDIVLSGSDSKLKAIRSFKGFLVNAYMPLQVELNGEPVTLQPQVGTFHFIYDFERFIPSKDLTIIGIENSENFRHIERQQYLFENFKPLFVSRYPQNQSSDLSKWLLSIPNNYLHFGDFDFAGIGIYLHEYKKHLEDKASFFIPASIEQLITRFGSTKRYDAQRINFDVNSILEEKVRDLIDLLHKHKKGLDQEIFVNTNVQNSLL